MSGARSRSSGHFLKLLAALCGLLLAAAVPAAAASVQGAIGAALDEPAQPKVGVTQAPASALQTTPRSAAERALDDAVASGDIRKALELGASAAEITRMVQQLGALTNEVVRGELAKRDPSQAVFVRTGNGLLAIGFLDSEGGIFEYRSPAFGDFAPPGGLSSLPSEEDIFGPPRPPQTAEEYAATHGPPVPTAAQLAIGQLVMSGGSAQQAAAALIASMGPGAPAFDPSTAQFVQGLNGDLALSLSTSGGGARVVETVPGVRNYPGLASLPAATRIFPSR